MNQLQMAIVGLIVGIIIVIIAYHFYQESKFKNSIDKNFNQSLDDALKEENGVVFENQMIQVETNKKQKGKPQRDVEIPAVEDNSLQQTEMLFEQPLDNTQVEQIPSEVGDEQFAAYDNINFPFANQISNQYQHVIDIFFEKSAKIKMFPDLNQFASKRIQYFILDSKAGWLVFERNKKYNAQGVKVVIDLVDNEGCIYPLQITNMFNELSKFASHHDAYIRQKDSELEIRRIQQQLKNLSHALLELELFIVNKDELSYDDLAKYFLSNGFVDNSGFFEYRQDGVTVFYIADENGKRLDYNTKYRIFSLNSKLHHQFEPMNAVNKIFDVSEDYMKYFESRLLTSNKLIMSEREYNALERQVSNYINTCKRFGLELGSELILRVYP